MAQVGTIASAAFTITVFAGFATGFIFLIVTGIRWARKRKESIASSAAWEEESENEEECSKCGRGPLGRFRIAACSQCTRLTCQLCSVYWQEHYLCTSCLKTRDQQLRSGVWFFKELRDRFKSTVAALRQTQKQKSEDVRDVIENLTEKLVGGSLDHVRVTRLTTHPAYTGFMERYQGVLSLTLSRLSAAVQFAVEELPFPKDESPKHVHLQLKDLIKDIIHDANSLPVFKGYTRRTRRGVEDLSTKTYEDILATAILNKIIEKFQIYPRRPSRHLTEYEKEGYSDSENSDPNSSEYSMEQGDAWSLSTDPLSLTLEENHKKNSSDEDIFEQKNSETDYRFYNNCKPPFPDSTLSIEDTTLFEDCNTPSQSWEDNWLFKRKKLRSKTTSSVTMLVPCPKDNVKALIGDTDADETSDLSDCSDSELVQLLNSECQKITMPKKVHNYTDNVKKKENEIFLKNTTEEIPERKKNYNSDFDVEYNEVIFSRRNVQETNSILSSTDPTKGSQPETKNEEAYGVNESTASVSRCEMGENTNDKVQNNVTYKDDTETELKDANNSSCTIIEEETLELPSVKQLAKHFSGKHNHHKVHSLTARNLSRGLQVATKKMMRNDNHEKEVINNSNIEEMSIPAKVLTNIAFWEQLATKAK